MTSVCQGRKKKGGEEKKVVQKVMSRAVIYSFIEPDPNVRKK